jgi:thiol-disulfide isomerase/thioredoxin
MNLKTIPLLLLGCFLTSGVFAQKGYTIAMDLSGFKDGTWFHLVNLDLGRATDSLQLKNGRGTFKGYVKEPVGCRIHTIDGKYLIIELDNSSLKVKGNYQDFGYATIEGSEINRVWTKSRDYQRDLHVKRDSAMQQLIRVMDTAPQQGKDLAMQVKGIDREIMRYRLSLIKTEKPSYFTIKELFFLRNDFPADTLKALYEMFPPVLQQTKYGAVVATYFNTVKAPAAGEPFVDIEGTDLQNRVHKLSEHKGKYVLLEFWASWCGPCIQEIPNLNKAYDTFHSKGFEIYSFSIDANADAWRKAVNKYQTRWTNVMDSKGSYSLMAAKYGVRAIPKNYLISPEGIVIAVDLRGEGLHKKLEGLIK